MAIYKTLTQSNGIVLSYHRVTSLNILTNCVNLIGVSSYLSRDTREDELAAYEQAAVSGGGVMMDVYVVSKTYEASYDQTMTIEGAYEYLKTLEDFEGAEDILEEQC